MYQAQQNAFLVLDMEKDKLFSEWIIDHYGSPEKLAQILESGIFMLFFLEQDTFSHREVQDMAEAIRGIMAGLRE